MKAKTIIETVELVTDARGWVLEPLLEEWIPRQRNIHVVLTEPGCIRGNHYHQFGTEVLVAVGPARIRVREDGQAREILVPEGKAMRLTLPPGVAHAIQNLGTGPAVLISFNTIPHDRAHPDTVRDVLIAS
jgi:dTDP-4-dehydrorhamnose 3,5-epimerase-like enzyme